jgi:hypothetical protein
VARRRSIRPIRWQPKIFNRLGSAVAVENADHFSAFSTATATTCDG